MRQLFGLILKMNSLNCGGFILHIGSSVVVFVVQVGTVVVVDGLFQSQVLVLKSWSRPPLPQAWPVHSAWRIYCTVMGVSGWPPIMLNNFCCVKPIFYYWCQTRSGEGRGGGKWWGMWEDEEREG